MAAAGTLRLSDAARVAVRNDFGTKQTFADADNLARADLDLAWHTADLSLSYAPRLSLIDVFGAISTDFIMLQSADAQFAYRQPRYRLLLDQYGNIGQQSFFNLVPQQTPDASAAAAPSPASAPLPSPTALRTDLLPKRQVIDVAGENSRATLNYRWSRRWSSELHGSYGFSGGMTRAAQAVLPRQDAAEAGATLNYQQTRRDQFGVGAVGSRLWTSSRFDYWLTTFTGTWSAHWNEQTNSTLSLGAAWQEANQATAATSDLHAWVPVAFAGLSHAINVQGLHGAWQLSAGYAPLVNPLAGELQDHLYIMGGGSLATEHTAWGAAVMASQTFPVHAPDAARFVGLQASAAYLFSKWVDATLALQVADQEAGVNAASGLLWTVYAGLALQTSPVRF